MELRSQMKLASKMRQYKSTLPVISSFKKFCVARTFWVERHLDVVLEVLQVVGSKKCMKLVDIYQIRMVALLMKEIFNLKRVLAV